MLRVVPRTASRTFWAFARDSAAPCWRLFARVDPKLQVPVPAIIAVTVSQMLLGLRYLGNSTAFNAILSMVILGMYASYILPIIYMVLYGRKKLNREQFGPFSMGTVLGPVVNTVALGWLVVAMTFSTFPSVQPVTAEYELCGCGYGQLACDWDGLLLCFGEEEVCWACLVNFRSVKG